MLPLVRRMVNKVVSFREGEATTALLMFAYSFLAMTAYNILKPVTRSKFISALGADNLPYVQLAAGVLIGLLMQIYSRAAGRLPRRWVIPVTQAGEAALLVVFWILFKTDASWVSVAFYVLGLVLGILLISQFWTLANDIYDARQAKRLFGFIGGGSSLGGAMGAGLTTFFVQTVGTNNLLLVSAALLGFCVLIVAVVVRRQDPAGTFTGIDERGVGSGEAIRLLRGSRHLQVIACVIGFAAVGAAIIDQQLNMAAEAIKGAGSTDAITGFLAQVTFYLSLIGFVVQVALTSRVHRSLGLAVALLILPVSLGTTATIILFNGALWAPAVARVLDSSLRYTIDKTTREVLFLPLPTDLKYRAKPFVDVTIDRAAKALGALLILILIKPWGLHLDWRRLSYASLAVTALWIALALVARLEYLRAFRRSIGRREIAPASVRLDVADAPTIETIVEELSSPDETAVLYAIDLLETLQKRNLVTPLLLHHASPKVRARALEALESARPSIARRWVPTVERLLKDEDADVRAAAIRALAILNQENLAGLMRRHLDDPEPRIALTAAVALARSSSEADVRLALGTFERLTADTRDTAAAGRREAAAALGRVVHPAARPMLAALVLDPDGTVAAEAMRSVRALGTHDPLFVPPLVALLGHRLLKHDAREALASFGPDVVPSLAYILKDKDEQQWVRRHIPTTLGHLPAQSAMDALWDALEDPDGFLRYKALAAIETLHHAHPEFSFSREAVEKLITREASRYCNSLTLRHNLVRIDPEGGATLVARALQNKMERSLDRMYRLLGLIYPWRDVAAARYTLEQGPARSRAGALEYLDNMLSAGLRRRVMPILDDTTPDEKARHANAVLKSRPRDLEDTLAQLIHEDDPVIASAAIHYVAGRRLWSLSDDIEYVLQHRSAADVQVYEAATWALSRRLLEEAALRDDRARPTTAGAPLPAVELADRLRKLPLFTFVSVDELFRIAAAGRQERHESGRTLYAAGAPGDSVQFLLDGAVRVSRASGPAVIAAPAALAFEETLQGCPLAATIDAAERTVCLRVGGAEFLAMMADSAVLAEGLFRMLLSSAPDVLWGVLPGSLAAPDALPARGQTLQPVDTVFLLGHHPLFARASVDQLLGLAAIVGERPIVEGETLLSDDQPPVIWHILEGELRLERGEAAPMAAGPGRTVGVMETLSGASRGWRATVVRSGRALGLERQDLFGVLSEDIDLVRGLFKALLGIDGVATVDRFDLSSQPPPPAAAPAAAV